MCDVPAMGSGASEHSSGETEHDIAVGASGHSMHCNVSFKDAIETLRDHKEAESKLA